MNKNLLTGLIGGATFIGGAGITAAIVIPVATSKAEKAFLAFLPAEGKNNSTTWKNTDKKLNYLAFGDSVSAGYVGVKEGDVFSYADILASDLKKADKLESYFNYAQSGDRIYDMHQIITQRPAIKEKLKEADLITFTIGGNDLLRLVELFDRPFSSFTQTGGFLADKPDGDGGTRFTGTDGTQNVPDTLVDYFGDTTEGETQQQYQDKLVKSLTKVNAMYKIDDMSEFVGVEEEVLDKIFDLVKRNIAVLVRDMHAIAKDAQIIISAPPFPFAQLPEAIWNTKRDTLGGRTLKELYNKILASVKDGATLAATGRNNFVEYYKTDDLDIKKSSLGTDYDADKTIFTDYIKETTSTNIDLLNAVEDFEKFKGNAMPNSSDIHPSTFGYELMGNGVFNKIYSRLGLTEPEALDNYTLSVAYGEAITAEQKAFERVDENLLTATGTGDFNLTLATIGGMGLDSMLTVATNPDPVKNEMYFYEKIKDFVSNDVIDGFVNFTTDKSQESVDLIKKRIQQTNAAVGVNPPVKTYQQMAKDLKAGSYSTQVFGHAAPFGGLTKLIELLDALDEDKTQALADLDDDTHLFYTSPFKSIVKEIAAKW